MEQAPIAARMDAIICASFRSRRRLPWLCDSTLRLFEGGTVEWRKMVQYHKGRLK